MTAVDSRVDQADQAMAQGELAGTLLLLTELAHEAAVSAGGGPLRLACASRLSRVLWLLGDTQGALEQQEAAFQLALRHGCHEQKGRAAGALAEALLRRGQVTEARRPMGIQVRSLRFCSGDAQMQATRKRLRGWELLAGDEAEQALGYANEALSLGGRAELDRLLALELKLRCLSQMERFDQARICARRRLEAARKAPGVSLLRRALSDYADLLVQLGQTQAALVLLREAACPSVEARPGGPLDTLKALLEVSDRETQAEAQRSLRVLLAEDNPINQRIISRQLQSLGLEVLLASDGPEALERTQALRPDLVLMDLQMPGMDGDQVTAALRDQGMRMPILALTASDYEEDIQRCMSAGMNAVLTKPLELELLQGQIGELGLRAAG